MTENSGWFVQRKDKLYGPFSLTKMKSFIEEGRIRGRSNISKSKVLPVYPAKEDSTLGPLFDKGPALPIQRKQESSIRPTMAQKREKPVKPTAIRKQEKPVKSTAAHKQEIPVKPTATQKREKPVKSTAIRKQEKSVKPAKARKIEKPVKPSKVQKKKKMAKPSKAKSQPFDWKKLAIILVILGIVFITPFWIIKSESPIKKAAIEKLQETSPIRKILKKPELPKVWLLWKEAVLTGINFSEHEIKEMHVQDIAFELDPKTLSLPAPIMKEVKSSITYIQAGGFYHTYLFDDDHFTLCVAISHVNFKRLQLPNYSPIDLGEAFNVTRDQSKTAWTTPLLEDFKGMLIWAASDDTHILSCILITMK